MHRVEIRLDQVSAAAGASKVGDVDQVRIVYDRNAIDPKTHRVRLINFQHFIGGAYRPEHPDSVFMPMNDAWLDLSRAPYRLHFHAAVTPACPSSSTAMRARAGSPSIPKAIRTQFC